MYPTGKPVHNLHALSTASAPGTCRNKDLLSLVYASQRTRDFCVVSITLGASAHSTDLAPLDKRVNQSEKLA